jgi:5-formyltetrahydrofolate cyclo-ligase
MLIRVGTEPNIQNWRDARRIELLAARIAVPMPQRRQWNHLVTQQLATYFPMLQSMVGGGYWPFRGEFDPRLLMRQLRDSGSRLALPVVVHKNTPLQFRSLSRQLSRGLKIKPPFDWLECCRWLVSLD